MKGDKRLKIVYSKPAEKFLKRQERNTANRIRKAIEMLPFGDVKRMQGKDYVLYRLRVGDFRVTFTRNVKTDDEGLTIETLYIEDIDNRGEIYK